MPEYTLATLITMIAVIAAELWWLRTGIFRSLQYWITLAIVMTFQVLVDGWLTKLSNPIVIYNPDTMTNLRWPWDIPVEDFGFGFAMVTLALMIWRRSGQKDEERARAEADVQADAEPRRGTGVSAK